MGKHYKEISDIALKRREAALVTEYLLPEASLKNLPQNLTTVPRGSGHFTEQELEIIEEKAEDTLLKIKERTWTSLEVTKAFCKASAVAQQLVRLITTESGITTDRC
jgi:amidase